jgi:AcrR family transcriptional regulator
MRPPSEKLAAADRKLAILRAATPVFARLGRDGATTKEIAKAAGISEALLYKHFQGKEALYAELENHCVAANAVGSRLFKGATPSTETLVTGVALLVQAVFLGIGARESHEDSKRLVTSSLLGDGHFAKAFLDRHVTPWVSFFEKSLKAAVTTGDVEEGIDTGKAELWFIHHLSNTLHLISLPDDSVVDYGVTQEELTERTIRFLLRGLGLKNSAIALHYKPEELKHALKTMMYEDP